MKIISPIDEQKSGNGAISCKGFVKKCEKFMKL